MLEGTKRGGWRSFLGLRTEQKPAVTKTDEVKPAVKPEGKPTVDVERQGAFGQVEGANKPAPQGPVSGAQKPWMTRLDVTQKGDAKQVALATLAVMQGISPDLLLEPVKSAALEMVQGDAGKAGDPAAMKRVYERCVQLLNPDAVREALASLVVAANAGAHAQLDVKAGHTDEVPVGKTEKRDWHRTWGLRLLPDDDAIWRDPAYLTALNQESAGIKATTYEGRTSVTSAREKFDAEWQKLAPNTKLLAFTESGSDSVSLCFQLALALGRRRVGDANVKPEMAFFDGSYGGGRGLAASMNFAGWGRYVSEDKEDFKLPSPTSTQRNPTGDELQRVQKEEAAALLALTMMLEDKEKPLGAIFLEPVQGANSVQFYRTEFLLELRKLADEHGVPIIADEVLTGGGRTGKFFAYENYEGFKPDFVVFGKGLQTSGIAAVERGDEQQPSQRAREFDLGVTTAGGDAVRFLKGAQVMKRIREGNLMEQANEVGAYLLQRLREVQQFHDVPADASGMGLLLGMSKVDGTKSEVSEAWGNQRTRYLPPLTLTKADVDEVISDLKKELPSEVLAGLQEHRGHAVERLQLILDDANLKPEDKAEWAKQTRATIAELDVAIAKREAELVKIRAKVT